MTGDLVNQLYPPPLEPRTLSRQVWDVDTARRLPGVGRALSLYGGLISQMPLDDVVGIVPQRRPRLLEQPDLDLDLATFIAVQVEDYLTHGNAAQLVTARDNTGWPAAVKWFPAHAWAKIIDPRNGRVHWYLNGREVPPSEVVHAQRGADPMAPHRGRGVIEQHLATFDRAALQEESERESLVGGGVPSAAVVAPPHTELGQEAVDAAAESWMEKYGGPGRRPAILPHGTVVTPLAWSPHDQQATEARKMSLTDAANAFNLDPYWLGAPGSSHTYRSPGPLFLNLLRVSLNAVVRPFELTWSQSWVPRGHQVTFDRQAILADDFASTITSLLKATGGKPVMTQDEARARIQLGPAPDELKAAPVPPQLGGPQDDDTDTDTDQQTDDDPEAAA